MSALFQAELDMGTFVAHKARSCLS